MGDLSKIARFFRLQKDRSLRQLLRRSHVGAAEGCDLLILPFAC